MSEAPSQIILLALLLASFYLLVLRPQGKRVKAAKELRESLRPGDRVMTTSGMHGRLVAVDGDVAVLEIAPGVQVRWALGAIGQIVEPQARSSEAPPA